MKTTHAVQFLTTATQLPIAHRDDLESEGLAAWYLITTDTNGKLRVSRYTEHPHRKAAMLALSQAIKEAKCEY